MKDHSYIDSAFEHAPYGMFVANLEGEIVAINRAMRTLLRHSSNDSTVVPSLPALLVNPDEMLDVFQLLYDGGRFDDMALAFHCADATARTLRVSASVLPENASGSKCFLATAMVPGKTSEGDPLETSRMHAVERLAAAVAHDLNNVLSAVVGYCHLLREPLRTNPQALQDLIAIEQSSDRAAAVVRQLLVFGRKRILEPEILNVAFQIDLLEPILRRVLPADTAFVVQHVDKKARILIDHMAFNEILILLLSARNPMTEKGAIHIQATVSQDNRLLLDVTDAGLELSVESIEKCVDELFASPESAGGYSGLGLAAVHVLVARSGGAIRVLDNPGLGTTFRLSFPTLDVEADVSENDERAAGDATSTGTVLLVEDDLALRDIARRVLSDEGYMVVEAKSGEEALAIAKERDRSFDVLVTDMMMPGIKGWEVGRAVKALHPDCAMVYVSGYVDSIRLRQELPEDAVFVSKPYVPPRLLEAVAAASARRVADRRTRRAS